MTLPLRAAQERLIRKAMEAGGYENATGVIVRTLEVLRAEEGHLHENQRLIAAKIDRALAQFDRGEFFYTSGREEKLFLDRMLKIGEVMALLPLKTG